MGRGSEKMENPVRGPGGGRRGHRGEKLGAGWPPHPETRVYRDPRTPVAVKPSRARQ